MDDVAEHIELALDGRPTPVDAWELRRVLDELGSPTRWVPPEELGPLRRALLNLRSAPDDLRLGYIAFGLLAATLLGSSTLAVQIGWLQTLPFLAIGLGMGFVFARAALAIMPEIGRAERWLLYPPVLAVVLPATTLALFWPFASAWIAGEMLYHELPWTHSFPRGLIVGVLLGLVGGSWWGTLAFLAWRWPTLIRDVFRPFLAGSRGHSAFLGFAIGGLLIFLAAAYLAASMLLQPGPLGN